MSLVWQVLLGVVSFDRDSRRKVLLFSRESPIERVHRERKLWDYKLFWWHLLFSSEKFFCEFWLDERVEVTLVSISGEEFQYNSWDAGVFNPQTSERERVTSRRGEEPISEFDVESADDVFSSLLKRCKLLFIVVVVFVIARLASLFADLCSIRSDE